uniref:SSD domain-containing protein n=1 Tax=Caenorhabditis japonica TaxID=281687 RepID=A0A8R1IQ23_CAEJA
MTFFVPNRVLLREFKSPEIRVLTLSTSYVESEVVRAGMSLLPFLIVGFVIMAIVSSVTTFISAFYMQQVSIHKFSLAIAACICPFMACGTALGALFFAGVRFGSILCVTPFLVLAIGVDDAYLMIHAWQRVTAERRARPVADDSPASRLAEVLVDTGPAILISALTNIFADVAGCFTSSPEISLLAYGNMASILCDFVYQITFYSAIMTITGRFEMREEEQRRHIKKIACGVDEDDSESCTVGFCG